MSNISKRNLLESAEVVDLDNSVKMSTIYYLLTKTMLIKNFGKVRKNFAEVCEYFIIFAYNALPQLSFL